MTRTRYARLIPVIATLALGPLPLGAQTVTGTLEGRVVDSSGAVVPGVGMAIRNPETGFERHLVTNERGLYAAPFLPLGRYRVSASLSGFGSVVHDRVDVRLNATRVENFVLDPKVTEEVTVMAERPPINTTNGEIKQSLTADEIMDKPTLNANSFLTLAETFPGFQENPTSGQNNPTSSSGSSINFNGTGTRGATFQINGVNNDDSSENQNRQGVSLSTIQEFQVISNNYSAEFGRGYGAVVLVQTKSGTNEVHGDAFVYHQQSDWNHQATFAIAKPVNHRNEYGGTLGFPIVKDKLLAFLSFDQTRRSGTGSYARDFFLPSELSAPRLTRGNDTPANRAFIDSVLARFPSYLTNNDPRSNRTYGGTVGFDQPLDDYTGRFDWAPSASDHVSTRWQYTRQIFDNDDVIVGEATRQNNRQQNMGLTWTHVFSSRTVGEFRYGRGIRDTNVDIKAGNDTPVIRFSASPVSGSIIGNAGAFPIHRDQTDNQFVYNLSSVLGSSHSLKVGTDIRFQKLDDLADNFSRGFYTFSSSCGGVTYSSAYAAFLDGCVSSYQKGYGNFFLENRIDEYNFYAQDSWKATPKLALDLGVRYEYVGAPTEKRNRLDYVYKDDKNNIEPRIAFAYVLGGSGNASLRGGYGIAHGRLFQSIFSQSGANVRFNPPNALLRSFTTLPDILNLADPTGGFVFTPGPQTVRAGITKIDPNLEMPHTHQWNLTYERRMPWNSTLQVSYNGTRGVGLLRYTLDNLPISPLAGGIVVVDHPNNAPAAGFPDLRGIRIDKIADDFLCAGTGLPGLPVNAQCPVPVPIANNEVSVRVPRTNERRPDPRYLTNLVVSNGADAWYHGLQVAWLKRLSHGLQFQMSYTWGKAIDTTSEATFVGAGDSNQLGPNSRFGRGLSRFDTRHRFTFNGSYLLPIFRDREDFVGKAFGGWRIAAVVKVVSGTPFTVIDTASGGDLDFDGFSENRPVVVDPSVLHRVVDDPDHSQEQLPAAAFRHATTRDRDGNIVGRNTFFGDPTRNVDLGLYKTFGTPWRHRLAARLEMYNAFNRTQFGFPTADLANANFGRILTNANAYSPRTIQVSFRYQF